MKKVCFSLVAVVAFFGATELGLRAIDYRGAPAPADFFFREIAELRGVPDPVLFWRLPNIKPRFTGRAVKIICLSDSVTVMDHGRGWPNLLPDALRELGYGRPVEVFNAGVPSYTSFQGRLYLQRELLREEPDVVVAEFGWNDHWPSEIGVADKDVRLPPPRIFLWQKHLARSRVYRLLRTLLIKKSTRNGTPRVSLADYRDNLLRIAEMTRAAGGRTVFATAPYLDGTWEFRDQHRAYIDATKRVAVETGAVLLDLVPEFLGRPDLFFNPDSDPIHINKEGSALLADAAARLLVAKGLLP